MKLLRILQPPSFDDEDTTRLAGLLHTLLMSIIVVLSVYTVSQVIQRGYSAFSFFLWANGALVVVSIGLLWLIRRGYVRVAGAAILLFGWLDITMQVWIYGGTQDASLAAYAIVIAASGLLLDWWWCLGFAGLSIVSGGMMAYTESVGLFHYNSALPYRLWIDHSLNFILLTVVILLISKSLHATLQRARSGEQALLEKNRELEAIRMSLEARVAERTRRLEDQNIRLQSEIEERHQAQIALQNALDREREMLDDVRVNLSLALPHELRTPLSSILGFSELLLHSDTLPEPDRIVRYAAGIRSGAIRLQKLVENTLLYANLRLLHYTSDRTASSRLARAYKVKDIILSIAEQTAKEARREADLVVDIQESRIYVQPEHFKKILTELLDNALKFSAARTPVHIRTETQARSYTIAIIDQGRGMSPEELQTIGAYIQFERRYYEQQGMGLGLVIASLLTQLEGGELTIESQKNQGTCVRLRFECFPEA